MDRDLSIQEIQLLAAYKTNNPNISEQEAVQIINSVLPDYQNKVNSWGVQSSNASAFGNNIVVSGLTECDTAQVVCNNLFQKLGFVQPKTTETLPVQVPPSEPTAKDVKLFAVDYLQNDLDKALSIYNIQINNQGTISNIFNCGKELFNTEFASSRVGRILANEQLGAQLLELSANYQLSQKDYLEAKLDLAVKLLGADSKDAKYLQSELGKLEPQKLNEFISKVLTLSDKDYAIQIPQIKENLTARALQDEQRANRPRLLDSVNFLNINFKNPNSVASLIENKDSSYKLMDFETTFLKERGVSYKPEAITDYTEKQAYLSLLLAANNRNKHIQNLLYDATTAVDAINKFGAPFQDATGACVNNLKRCLAQAYIELYGEEKINVRTLNAYELVRISQNLQDKLEESFNRLLNGKTFAEYEAECKQAYNLAYGEENGTRLAEAFVESQAKGVQAIKAGVQGAGMLVAIAGQVIPVGGQIASALIWSGMAIGTFGGASVQIVEDATKTGGITEEDKKAILQEIATSAALMAAGGAVGKVSSLGFTKMVMTNCPRTLSYATKYGMDVILGAVADMAITGDYNISQETVTNLIPVIIGLSKTKGSMVRFVQNEMLDAVGTLPKDYFRTHPQEFDRVINIMLKNQSHLGHIAHLEEPKWKSLIQSIENPPTGSAKDAIMVYKNNSTEINNLSSAIKSGKAISADEYKTDIKILKTYIKNITDYIDTQILKEPITVYRDDGNYLLTCIKLNNGNTIAEEMKIISKVKDEAIADKLTNELSKKAYNSSVVQERFMSTTFIKDLHFDKEKDIRWEFSVPAGAKGTFVEPYNILKNHGNEVEYLIQRDSKIVIKNIQKNGEKWYIKADIVQE